MLNDIFHHKWRNDINKQCWKNDCWVSLDGGKGVGITSPAVAGESNWGVVGLGGKGRVNQGVV